MATPNITINPALTSNAGGTFNVSADGLVQGTAYPDPATRYSLNGGLLATTETIPMWGGVGIYEDVPGVAGGAKAVLGPVVGRATALTGTTALSGFSVFDQAYGMLDSPQSPVPLAAGGGQVMYYRLGSKARIAVACDATLVALRGKLVTTSVSWDFANQQLVPYSAPTFSSATYTSGSGAVTVTTSAVHGLQPGDQIIVSGATGTGSFAAVNGQYTLIAGTTGSTLVYTIATGLTLTISGMTLATGGILPVSVLDVQTSNCMTVTYNSTSGFATWNYNGACAVILI